MGHRFLDQRPRDHRAALHAQARHRFARGLRPPAIARRRALRAHRRGRRPAALDGDRHRQRRPRRSAGFYASIVGGFFVSALGGSRFQIGGPAGAFIVLVAACVARHGVEGLLLAAFMSGFMLMALGFLRLGTYIKFIPYPVTVGFTSGIAVIIFASQIKDLLGLRLPRRSRGRSSRSFRRSGKRSPRRPLPPSASRSARSSSSSPSGASARTGRRCSSPSCSRVPPAPPSALAPRRSARASARSPMRRRRRTCRTSRGRRSSRCCPTPSPSRSSARSKSLLSAVVADGMTGPAPPLQLRACGARGRQHRLQPLRRHLRHRHHRAHGDECARRRARADLRHLPLAVRSLLFLLLGAASPSISRSPRWPACLRSSPGTWPSATPSRPSCAPRPAMRRCSSRPSASRSSVALTEGIVVGFALGALLFIHRMSQSISVETAPLVPEDVADGAAATRTPYAPDREKGISIYRISGALFFGAASAVAAVLERLDSDVRAPHPRFLGGADHRFDGRQHDLRPCQARPRPRRRDLCGGGAPQRSVVSWSSSAPNRRPRNITRPSPKRPPPSAPARPRRPEPSWKRNRLCTEKRLVADCAPNQTLSAA